MTQNSIVRQPFNDRNHKNLRALFKQYLKEEKTQDHLTWERFTTQNGLPHNWIYDLFEDSQGRIWVGTWGGGLACYEKGGWLTLTMRDGLHSNEVTCIREDKQGRIWLATDAGLNIIRNDRIENAGLEGKSLLNITFDHLDHLWVGCWRAVSSGAGLFRFDGHSWESFTTRQNLPGLEILKVFNDSRGQIWVGTYEQGIGAGVGCYDGRRWQKYTAKQGLADDCVYSMFEDPSGNMWFGSMKGVSIFDGKTWHTLTDKDGLVDNRIYCMLIDSHKKMWFGTEGGVSRFDGQSWVSYTKKDGLVENLIRSIIEAQDGSLWFGSYPYARGLGGISVARYQSTKSLPDRVLGLLPEPPAPLELPPGEDDSSDAQDDQQESSELGSDLPKSDSSGINFPS
jgi:ligand-binding sensor domain-containing protein